MLSAKQISKLQMLEQKVKNARARHRANRKLRGHKSPSELRRRKLRETLFLLAQLPPALPDVDDIFVGPSPPLSDVSCDETDWFAGNEWCEGSF
uniref:2b protein n=1 Tax=Peanut stunt virus TaxID=12313 RepID=B1VCU0_9BROM|nr:2b protein [Peanut stunt virus]